MKFLIGLVVGAIMAAAIGAAAIAYASRDGNGHFSITDRDDQHDDDKDDSSGGASRTLDLVDFDKIDARGVFDLDVTVGSAFAIELSGKQANIDRVEARVENGELILDQRDRQKGEDRGRSVNARISLPALSAIEASGVVDGDITGVAGGPFKVEISGVGDMEIEGACDSLDADVSGVGELDAGGLKCKSVDVTVSGVGDASVYASEAVNATVSGMGEISISGSPAKVEKNGGMFSNIHVK